MAISFNEEELPEVVLDKVVGDEYTYVTIGDWSFCVEDDLEDGLDGRWWRDAKTFVAYAKYLDKVKEERGL
jgi:hypothetical protein